MKPFYRKPDGGFGVNWRAFLEWENWRVDWKSLMIVFLVVLSSYVYVHDTAVCREFVEDQCGFCERSGCFVNSSSVCYEEQYFKALLGEYTASVIDDFNWSGVNYSEVNS